MVGILILLNKFFSKKQDQLSILKILINEKSNFGQEDIKNILNNIYQDSNQSKLEFIINYQSSGIAFLILTKADRISDLINIFNSYDRTLDFEAISINQDEIFSSNLNYSKIFKLYFKKHFCFPFDIKNQKADPLATLTLNFSKLAPNDSAQIILKINKYQSPRIKYLKKYLLSGRKVNKFDYPIPFMIIVILKMIFRLILDILIALLKIIELFSTYQPKNYQRKYNSINYDQKTARSLDKLYDGLFKVDFSVILRSNYLYRVNEMSHDLNSFIATINNDSFQKLKLKDYSGRSVVKILTTHKINVWSSEEIGIFYRLPKIDNLNKYFELSSYKKLYLTANHKKELKKNGNSLILGISHDQSNDLKVGLSENDRERHLLIVGTTGSGKSSLLYNLITQDIKNNRGVCLIDPHGDLAVRILNNLNTDEAKKVIELSSKSLSNVKINLLENNFKPGTKQFNTYNELIVEQVSAIFRKLFNDKNINSSRIDYILRNAIYSLLVTSNNNLFKVFDLFTDKHFLDQTIKKIKDQRLKKFWEEEYKKAGDFQKIKMTFGVSSKIGRLLFSSNFRAVFDCTKSSINFSDIINNGRIVIANLAKGEFGEDESNLIGLFIVAKIEIDVISKSSIHYSLRPNFYLYIDEFQNYINNSFCQLLAEVRKYGLYVTMAEQSTAMQDYQLTSKLLANISNYAVFKLINRDDIRLFKDYFSPYLSENDFLNIANFNFYFSSFSKGDRTPVSLRLT